MRTKDVMHPLKDENLSVWSMEVSPLLLLALPIYLVCSSQLLNPRIIAGGRKRPKCEEEGCSHLARNGSSFCTGHGGGPVCRVNGCSNRASWRHTICKECRANEYSNSGGVLNEDYFKILFSIYQPLLIESS